MISPPSQSWIGRTVSARFADYPVTALFLQTLRGFREDMTQLVLAGEVSAYL
jgi:hypothetical protein